MRVPMEMPMWYGVSIFFGYFQRASRLAENTRVREGGDD